VVDYEAFDHFYNVIPVASSGICDPGVGAKAHLGVINVEVERTVRLAGGCDGALDCIRIGWADYAVFVQTYDNGSYHLAPFRWVDVLCDMAFCLGVVFLQLVKVLPELFWHVRAASVSPSVRRIDSPKLIAVQLVVYDLVVLGHCERPSLVKQGNGSIRLKASPTIRRSIFMNFMSSKRPVSTISLAIMKRSMAFIIPRSCV
jgi:hypothetical protein